MCMQSHNSLLSFILIFPHCLALYSLILFINVVILLLCCVISHSPLDVSARCFCTWWWRKRQVCHCTPIRVEINVNTIQYNPISTQAAIWDIHVNDTGKAACGSSSQSLTQEVTSVTKFTGILCAISNLPLMESHIWCLWSVICCSVWLISMTIELTTNKVDKNFWPVVQLLH